MAGRAQRQHQVQNRLTRHPMMHNNGALIPSRGVTDTAAVAVAFQDRLSQATEVFLILPFQRVAGRAETKRKHLSVTARTVQDLLAAGLQFPFPATYR